ncbi:MAG TPA: AraC family transcriptional regulator [Acidimicrobiales bacterium]|nr:AraC family transcriptional regulator [Acidimicrobiales bacterium]
MGLDVEHRPSESPYITRVWRATGEQTVEAMTAVAYARWDLVFWEADGAMHVSVVGPESRAYAAPVPDATVSFGINFELGSVLPQLPASRQVDGVADLPDATGRRFQLAGSTWDLPSYDNAEAFVAALVREGLLVQDRLVTDLHRGASTDLSPRTEQRRFAAATGLTRSTARQIDRARNAAVLIQEGRSFDDVIAELGYYDQAHLGRSLSHYIGRTPTQLRRDTPDQPLSLLYKT